MSLRWPVWQGLKPSRSTLECMLVLSARRAFRNKQMAPSHIVAISLSCCYITNRQPVRASKQHKHRRIHSHSVNEPSKQTQFYSRGVPTCTVLVSLRAYMESTRVHKLSQARCIAPLRKKEILSVFFLPAFSVCLCLNAKGDLFAIRVTIRIWDGLLELL